MSDIIMDNGYFVSILKEHDMYDIWKMIEVIHNISLK